MVLMLADKLPVYGNSEWNVNIRITSSGEPTDFSIYDEITVTWRVKEFNPINVLTINSPRDDNVNGVLKIRATHEQAASMRSDGVFDIFGDNVALVKGYTVWEPNVK